MTQTNEPKPRFTGLGIAENLLAVLGGLGFINPTPIQHQVIPIALEGKDVVGIAQTGTGKTLAFGIPLIQQLGLLKGTGLVILPTRELALQVEESLAAIGRPLKMRTAVLIGGTSMHPQVRALRNRPHVVIATPGRLADHIKQKNYSLSTVKMIVLDEADRMLDIGFLPEIKRILDEAPKERQTLLFSATMPQQIAEIASRYMKMPLRIEVAPQGTSAEKVEQEVCLIQAKEKFQLLDKVLHENEGQVLIFSRTKHGAKKIARYVRSMKITATEIHSNRSQSQRQIALKGFKDGKFRVLVATDIAARGIDVEDIRLVINYDLPDNSEDYVHRIGRTGRAGKSGKAISFATPDQRRDVKQIERLIRKTLPLLNVKGLPSPRPKLSPEPEEVSPYARSGSRSFRGRTTEGRSGDFNYAPRNNRFGVSKSRSSGVTPRSSRGGGQTRTTRPHQKRGIQGPRRVK